MALTSHAAVNSRSLHLIDLEDIVGALADEGAVRRVWSAHDGSPFGPGPHDRVVVATGRRLAKVAWFALPGSIQRVVRSRSARSHPLLDAIDIEHAARRYERLVIVSGDEALAPLAMQALDLHMRVHVVGAFTVPVWALNDAPSRPPARSRDDGLGRTPIARRAA